MTSRRKKIWLTLALSQLILVACGAAYLPLADLPVVGRVFSYYGAVSGASNTYGFFAPGVFTDLRAQFDVTDRSGKTKTYDLKSGKSHEADLRVGDIIDQFDTSDEADDEAARGLERALAASLAGTFFGQHPEAKYVTVRLEEYDPVSMQEYRDGIRAKWTSLYSARFQEKQKAAE